MNPLRSGGRAEAFRVVLRFTFAHWRRQGLMAPAIGALVVVSTLADVLMPVFAGKLVDAVARGVADRVQSRNEALAAFGAILALGAAMVVLRHLAFLGVIRPKTPASRLRSA